MGEDVQELRERAQQLAARHGRLTRERAERRIAEHRIGHRFEQPRALAPHVGDVHPTVASGYRRERGELVDVRERRRRVDER